MVKKIAGIFLPTILVILLSLSTEAIAADPPPPPEADITVTDSVSPVDDQDIPFGNVSIGNSSDQTVTVTNDGNINLSIGQIANANPLASPFSLSENCSGKTLIPEDECIFTITCSPSSEGSFNDTFNIPSNDPDENPVPVTVSCGTLSAPQLIYPSNGQTCTKTTEKFIWKKSTDPDGDSVTYKLQICEDENFTTGCITEDNIAFITNKSIYYAGTGSGLLIIGIVLAGSLGNKKRLALLLTMTIIAVALFVSCGSSGNGDTPKTIVSGTVLDINGDPIEGAEVTISSDPVYDTTDSNGYFSVEVEAGDHEIKIMKDSVEIYSGKFTCKKDIPYSMDKIDTNFIPDCEHPNAPTTDPSSEISYEVSGLKAGTKYYWKVVADDGFGEIADSEVRSFTTK